MDGRRGGGVQGPGGEGQNAQMQDCNVFYHENGTTLAINY